MPREQAENIGRLLNHPFTSQISAIQRNRATKPQRLVAWFKNLESDLERFKGEYQSLVNGERGTFKSLQVVYESIMDRPFKGHAVTQVGDPTLTMMDVFKNMSELVKVIAGKFSNGLFIVGPGGTGKTFTVMQTLERDLNLVQGQQFIRIPGYSTPLSLYQTLYANLDKLIVFDDCDSIFKDVNGLNILKSALDTLRVRKIAYHSNSPLVPVPEFIFQGQVIFISNLDPEKTTDRNFQALVTRVLTLVVGNNKEQILHRMLQLLPIIGSDLTPEQREDMIVFLHENYRVFQDLSLRLLVHLCALCRYNASNWKALALSLR